MSNLPNSILDFFLKDTLNLIEQLSRVHNDSARNFIHLFFTSTNFESKKREEKVSRIKYSLCLDPKLLSYLTKSLVRLSTHHKEMITNETMQLRGLLANTSLNDDVRVRSEPVYELECTFLYRLSFSS